jgi:hypothetical protein
MNQPSWHDVSDRYLAPIAPPGLHLTQALANSPARTPDDYDPLADITTARAWIDTLAQEWVAVHGGPQPRIELTSADLDLVHRLRATVLALLLPGNKPDVASVSSPVDVVVDGHRIELIPTGTGGQWLASAVSAELLLAQQDDVLRRLKLCREPGCRTAFYDRSNNNSKVWHNVDLCGAAQRMREYRQRRRLAD